MIDIRFQSINMLYLLWAVPVAIGFYLYARHQRRRAMALFVETGILGRIRITVSSARRGWKAALLVSALVLLALALTRPGWNPKPTTIQRRGRDIVFLLDVSKSMLAEDLAPTRLERAKLAVRDCLERVQGDRVALVAFAGSSTVKCPLTLDYGFFGMMLDNVSTDSIARGGTIIGDAIRKTLDEVFDDQQRQYKDIILITDGEDHDSFPVEAAKLAGERGVRILAIGLGDENEGRRIPITDESGNRTFMKHNGREVWTKLDADTLRKMANATEGGKYLNVATGAFDLGQIYQQLVATAEKKELESKTMQRYEEKFQIFLGMVFLLLCCEAAISERRKKG